MDAIPIEAFDDGVYAHFDNQISPDPHIRDFMMPAYYFSSWIGLLALMTIVMLVFIIRGKRRGAIVALIGVVCAIGMIQAIHVLVPRPYPPNADKWLGIGLHTGSFPSAAVFLFMLEMILLGAALWDCLRIWQRCVFVVLASALVIWVCMAGFILAFHYLSDMFGGLFGAALFGWIACRLMAEKPAEPIVGAAA
jgi:hypothetical protein